MSTRGDIVVQAGEKQIIVFSSHDSYVEGGLGEYLVKTLCEIRDAGRLQELKEKVLTCKSKWNTDPDIAVNEEPHLNHSADELFMMILDEGATWETDSIYGGQYTYLVDLDKSTVTLNPSFLSEEDRLIEIKRLVHSIAEGDCFSVAFYKEKLAEQQKGIQQEKELILDLLTLKEDSWRAWLTCRICDSYAEGIKDYGEPWGRICPSCAKEENGANPVSIGTIPAVGWVIGGETVEEALGLKRDAVKKRRLNRIKYAIEGWSETSKKSSKEALKDLAEMKTFYFTRAELEEVPHDKRDLWEKILVSADRIR